MEETIDVPQSEDNGNMPIETPIDEPKTETPAEKVETTEPVVPTEAELFELPDGRKVDGETLAKEWKQNFLPEFTRKSQELAKLTKGDITNNQPTEIPNTPYADPDWVPDSYQDLLKIAEERVLSSLEAREKARIEGEMAIENEVVNQLNEVKTIDPNVNENALFLHANKYGFRDLKLAHQNMSDMSNVVKKTQTITAQNIAKRNDPVNITPGASSQRPDPSQFSNAVEYMRSLKN